jgi:RNA polymerase sigma-70 factor (ECF subfamily)
LARSTGGSQIAYDFNVLGEVKSDAELAHDLLTGNEEAFTQFVNAFHARLSHYSFLMCGQREDAEEVAQETLIKVFESIDELRDPGRLKAWVFRIAKNECLMKRRKSAFAPKTELSLDELRPRADGEGHMAGIEIADWDSLPDNLLLDSELQSALMTSIQQLPETYRSVVLLRDVEGLSTNETAEVLELTPDTVKTRLHRGRLALRQYMDLYLRNTRGGRRV